MKFRRYFFAGVFGWLVAVAVVLPASAATNKSGRATTSDASKAPPTFARTKSHIEALLAARLKPQPLPEILPNPFQLEIAPPPENPGNNSKPIVEELPPSDSEMLVYYGASLRISGTVRINDETHLVINQSPYKAGDIFTLKTKDGVVKLRIISIAPGELTVGYNQAVQVIKFKK